MRYLFHGGRHAQPRDEANSGFRVAVSALVCYPQKPPVRCTGALCTSDHSHAVHGEWFPGFT